MVDRGQETLRPVQTTSIFEQLAGAARGFLGAEQNAGVVRTRRAAAQRQANQDAIAAGDRSAENDFARHLPDILHPSQLDAASQAAQTAAQQAVADLSPSQAAVRQGRVTRDALELRTETQLRALIAAHPGSANVIVDQFRQNGLLSPLMRSYTEAADAVRTDEQSYAINERHLVEVAQNELGLQITPDMPNAMRERILNTTREHIAARTADQENTARFTAERARVNATREDQNHAREEYSRGALSAGLNAASAQLSALQVAITQLVDSDLPDNVKDQRLSQLVAQIESGANLQYNNFITQHPDMSSADQQTLRDSVTRYIGSMRELVTGPNSIVQQRVRTQQLIQTNLGINAAQAMPFYTRMKGILGSNAAADALFQTLASNPDLTNRMRQELQGYSQLEPGAQAVRMNNIANIIAGRTNIRDYSPAEARQMIPTVVGTLHNLAANPAARNGTDANAHIAGVTAIGQIANVAIDAVPQWGVQTLAGLINDTLTARNVTPMLFNTQANPTERINAVHAYIPAMTRVIQALRTAPTGDENYDVQFNSRSGRFEAVQSAAGRARGIARGMFGPTIHATPVDAVVDSVHQATLSSATQTKVNALNRAVGFMTNVSGQGYDDAVPRNTPARDRTAFYATGVPPASIRGANAAPHESTGQQALRQLDEVQQHVGDWIAHIPVGVQGTPADSPAQSRGRAVALEGNNPGGLNDGEFARRQPGYTGANGRYASFRTMEDGLNAQRSLLRSYVSRGINTPMQIAARWAPQGDGANDPVAYANNIARAMGIGPNDTISTAQIEAFVQSQAHQENSNFQGGRQDGGAFSGVR